ncbi:MAG: molybdopterin-binding protein [Chloroflexota bacterium]|nr:molybdopterin-binding protein [Chloroflexota bacterium]
MPTAEIITIGTELLLGETVDTNTRYIARTLRCEGVNLYRTSTIGDNKERIAEIIREGSSRADIIITTGGLGPTVDDPTRDAIALAANVETEFMPELWEQIQERFQRYGHTPTENNKRQAYIPSGATPIENEVGTAPAFIVEIPLRALGVTGGGVIIALPGVPREMEYLMQKKVLPFLRQRFNLKGIIKTRLLHTSGVGESILDTRIGDLERLSNPTVGLAAHAGQVDVRITAKADSEPEADDLIQTIEAEIRARIGHWIYGVDDDTLQGAAAKSLLNRGWKLAVVEANLGARLLRRLASNNDVFAAGEVLSQPPSLDELTQTVRQMCDNHQAQVGIGVLLIPGETQQTMHLVLLSPEEEKQIKRTYGGPPQMAPLWAVNLCLDLLRKLGSR